MLEIADYSKILRDEMKRDKFALNATARLEL